MELHIQINFFCKKWNDWNFKTSLSIPLTLIGGFLSKTLPYMQSLWKVLNLSPMSRSWLFFSIFNRSSVSQVVTLILDSKPVSVLCQMGNFGCGNGGWTPVMKIDGNKVWRLFYLSSLNLYLKLGRSTYVKKPCGTTEQPVVLHVYCSLARTGIRASRFALLVILFPFPLLGVIYMTPVRHPDPYTRWKLDIAFT